jgi:hypothetical protein
MEKYKELYNLSKEVLNEELSRFARIDDKAAKYLSILTLVAGVSGFFGKWLIDNLIPPKTTTEWALVILGAFLFIMIFVSWFLIFNVLRIHTIVKMPLDAETIDFFDNNELIDIYYALAKGNKDALAENRKITNQKSQRLYRGYVSIIISGIILALFLAIFVIHSWNGPNKIKKAEGGITMADDKNQDTTSQGGDSKPDVKPKPGIKPPKYGIVTEGFDPSKIKDKVGGSDNKE